MLIVLTHMSENETAMTPNVKQLVSSITCR